MVGPSGRTFRRQYERSCYLVNMETSTTPRKTRSDGERSRRAILEASAKLATVEGLRGLTIGGLAESLGMSKSGLYAHFGSKEELQLATIDAADEVFQAEVVEPATAAGGAVEQILELSDRFLDYVGSDVFPGGCFFAAASAEVDTHPGRVRERIAAFQAGWMRHFVELISEAQRTGDIDSNEDPMQLGFELNSMLTLANSMYVMFGDRSAFDRARRGIRRRLGAGGPARQRR
ncbi:MAG: TetR/AcrR family transcriptional regulator [Actinomycetota bacterium]